MSQGILTKFETRSNRVKGISFHPKRPWVLCGLHNGAVQIWDYRMSTSIDRYEEHEGPVRGVDFHSSQPLFVTGGDDYKIKVWNFKLRRCLFTMTGHLDYIRTVQFHKEQPWILSSSDDQTIRIWNWQSRNCVSVLTGHNHYVMSAQFHPREDLIVSASLDLTIRVWDISGLRARKQDSSIALPQDLFGSNDVVVKFILEGHEKGVNWASFHPTKPYIVSAADDRSIRVWKMEETRTYEVEQLRGHTNNVSCVTYFKDYIISNGEDRTIRVWDPAMRTATLTFRRETDRFWILATHPESNLLAAGHDGGMFVFKLARERPAWTIHNGLLYYVRDFSLRTYDFETKAESCPMQLRRHLFPPLTISCNPADNMAVLYYDVDGGAFELFTVPKPGSVADADVKRGFYNSAVFFAANKFAVLDKTLQIVLRTTNNDISKVLPSVNNCNKLFPGPQGFLVCRNDEKVFLLQVAQRAVVAEYSVPNVKYVVWDKDFNKVALVAKHAITVLSRKFKHITTVTEPSIRIKSVAFDEERDVMFFATSNHVKYCNLRNSDCGTMHTVENPLYLVRARGDVLWYITREGKVVRQQVENLELNFKLALQQERFRDVLKIIQTKRIQGQALVGYLHKHNHPEIAMHFVNDPLVRFNLAVECGAMDIAKSTATELNKPDVWRKLAETAAKFGDIQLAQLANAKVQNYNSLGFQCVLTGNIPALGHVLDKSKDESFKIHYSLFSGDVEKRINALVNCGQLPLALTIARSNGLEEVAESILAKMKPEVAERCKAIHVFPATPLPQFPIVADNWPLLPVQESYFSRMLKEPGMLDLAPEAAGDVKASWGGDDDLDFGDAANAGDDDITAAPAGDSAAPAAGGGEWDDDLDIDIGMLPPQTQTETASVRGGFVLPREGESAQKHWADNSQIAAHLVAGGAFTGALQLLQRQIGLVDPAPLQPYFMQIWASVNALQPTWSLLPSHLYVATARPASEELRAKHAPLLPAMLPVLTEKVKLGYAATTEGRFLDAHRIFLSILHQIVFTIVDDKKQLAEVLDILAVAREYVMALNVEITRKETKPEDISRMVELAVYFTHFKLQNTHVILSLGQAMTQAFKVKNFKTAANLARRILDLDPPQDRAERARKVIVASEQNLTDAIKLDYDDRNPFTLCSVSKKPMYRGTVDPIRCSYCYAPAHPSQKGGKCVVCGIASLGAASAGMINGVFQLK